MDYKKKHFLITSVWLFLALVVRAVIYLFGFKGVSDNYGYFDCAILALETNERLVSSGLGFAYANILARFIAIFGDNIDRLFYFQMLLEGGFFLFMFLGIKRFNRFWTAFISCVILSVSPMLIDMCQICTCEPFFLFCFGLEFYFLGLFANYTRVHHWTRSTEHEFIVLAIAIYNGVLIAWNYMGLLLFGVFLVIQVINYRLLSDKANLQKMVDEEIIEEQQIMSGFWQIVLYIFGLMLGLFFSLLRYTGYSGYTLIEQFNRYIHRYSLLPRRTMDLNTNVSVMLCSAIVISVLIERLFALHDAKLENILLEKKSNDVEQAFVDRGLWKKGDAKEYFYTEDGRRVNYLENPLPTPSKVKYQDNRFNIDELVKENKKVITFYSYDEYELVDNKSENEENSHSILTAEDIEDSINLSNMTESDAIELKSKHDMDFDHLARANDEFDIVLINDDELKLESEIEFDHYVNENDDFDI